MKVNKVICQNPKLTLNKVKEYNTFSWWDVKMKWGKQEYVIVQAVQFSSVMHVLCVLCFLHVRPEMAGVQRQQETGELRRAGSQWRATRVGLLAEIWNCKQMAHVTFTPTFCECVLLSDFAGPFLLICPKIFTQTSSVFTVMLRYSCYVTISYLTVCLYIELLVFIVNQVSVRPSCPRRNGRRGGKSWRQNGQNAKLLKVLWN